VGRNLAIMVPLLLVMASMAGCLELDTDGPSIDLVVSFNLTNGTLVEYHEEGEYKGQDNVSLQFDFAGTTSTGNLQSFHVMSPGLLEEELVVSVTQGTLVTVNFSHHGLHEVRLWASDDTSHEAPILTLTVRIDWRLEWRESATNEPLTLSFDTRPYGESPPPTHLLVESTVENPALIENLGGGQDVEITWGLYDNTDSACQSQPGKVKEGESSTWKTVHFKPVDEHKLRIEYVSGQDTVNVNQQVSLEYEVLETPPNA